MGVPPQPTSPTLICQKRLGSDLLSQHVFRIQEKQDLMG